MIYVLNKDGNPLMPTERCGKVRHLLKDGKAKVVRRTPFTIQLLYDSTNYVQPVSLGIDAGSKHIGVSATTKTKELLSAQIEVRDDINKKLEARRSARCSRRNRKTRYRKARFLNRTKSKHKGWLAPSVNAKCKTHVNVAKKVCKMLPISEIHIEMAPFDTQMLKAEINSEKLPSGEDYQHGESECFDNIKAYVKWRDGYKCAICGKEHIPLQVHHRLQRHDGGSNMPSNLITVCEDCHKKYHAGQLTGKKVRLMEPNDKVPPIRDASFMGIMRWAVWNKLKEFGIPLYMTFGYKTAELRKKYDLPKEHRVDARCISGNPTAKESSEWFFCKKVRCHNRQIHKFNISKGGVRKRNQTPHEIFGFRLFDKVICKNREGFIFGRRSSGSFDIRTLDGEKLSTGIIYKKLNFLEPRKNVLIERRNGVSSRH